LADVSAALGTDSVRIAAEFGDEERECLQRTRAYVDDEVLPVISEHWERAELPDELVRRMGALGLVGDGIDDPGVPATSAASAGPVAMEGSRGDGSLATFAGVQAGLAMRSIDCLGSGEQKARRLPALARCDALGEFALTEPEHCSDSVLPETTAVLDGDENVLDGAKRWIGRGSIADVVVLLDDHVMRHLADVQAIHTCEGTETIQTLLLGRDVTGVGAFV
jgi:glutaryl-CoA dehydrogenase